jgi:hypothetical protein
MFATQARSRIDMAQFEKPPRPRLESQTGADDLFLLIMIKAR